MYTFAIAEKPISYEKIKQIQVNKELGRLVFYNESSLKKKDLDEEEDVLVFESTNGHAFFMFYDSFSGKHSIIEFMEQLFDTKIYCDLDFLLEKEFERIRKQHYSDDILKVDMSCEGKTISVYVRSGIDDVEIVLTTTYKNLGLMNRNVLG